MSIYEVAIGTGLAWPYVKQVEAANEQEAVDIVADELVEHESGFVMDHHEIADLCETGETVDEYAEAHNLICCGNTGVYLEVVDIRKTGEI